MSGAGKVMNCQKVCVGSGEAKKHVLYVKIHAYIHVRPVTPSRASQATASTSHKTTRRYIRSEGEEEEEEEEEIPALYLGKLSLWTLQQEIGRLKNGF